MLVSALHSLVLSYFSSLILNLFVSFLLSSTHSGNLLVLQIAYAPSSLRDFTRAALTL